MKSGIAIVVLGLLVTNGWGQVKASPPGQPSSLDSLARQPGARVIWSKEVGQLESGDSHAVVTALVVEDGAQQGRRMRGIRIDLWCRDWRSTFHLDDSLLQPLKTIFDKLSLDIERHLLPAGAGWGFIGSCEFRDHPKLYALSADFCYSGPDAPALRVFGPQREQLMFPGIMPSHLAGILATAIKELNGH